MKLKKKKHNNRIRNEQNICKNNDRKNRNNQNGSENKRKQLRIWRCICLVGMKKEGQKKGHFVYLENRKQSGKVSCVFHSNDMHIS